MKKFVCLAVFALVPAMSLSGQEVGWSITKTFSGNYEIESPFGVEVNIAIPSNSNYKIQFGYQYHQNTREFFGPLWAGFLSGPVVMETVQSRSSFRTFEFSAFTSLFQNSAWNLYIGIGLSRNEFMVKREGLTTHRTGSSDLQKTGGHLFIQPEVKISSNIPLYLYGNCGFRKFLESSFATDAENPFGAAFTLMQIRVGLSLKL